MKTPLQELIEKLNNVKPTEFCSIETIKGWAESMLEKEKEQMVDFANDLLAQNDVNYIAVPNLAEQYYNETFNTNER